MNEKDQLKELIKAQDMIRRVYSEQTQGDLNILLREIDKKLSKGINLLGKSINNN